MQRAWGGAVTAMGQIEPECQVQQNMANADSFILHGLQENFVAIIRRALQLGINHFETARGYGCSELQ